MTLAVFPSLDGLEWNITKRADFKTSVFEALSGKESRVKLRQTPKTTFKLSYEFLIENQDEQQLTELLGFMLNRGGSYEAFLYNDPTDNSVKEYQFAIGDGLTWQFPLTRSLGTYVELVQNINTVTAIYLNGTALTAGTFEFPSIVGGDYIIGATGQVTFAVPPPANAVLTWTGSYYYRCRFLQDGYDFTQLMKDLHDCKDIDFIGAVSNKV